MCVRVCVRRKQCTPAKRAGPRADHAFHAVHYCSPDAGTSADQGGGPVGGRCGTLLRGTSDAWQTRGAAEQRCCCCTALLMRGAAGQRLTTPARMLSRKL